jgi:S1-C subfamily serine protease
MKATLKRASLVALSTAVIAIGYLGVRLVDEANMELRDLRVVNTKVAEEYLRRPPAEPALSDVVEESTKGVVHLQCPRWQGSGFVVAPRLIATARHCVEGVTEFVITTHDGHKLRASRAMSSKGHDYAFVYIDDLTCINGEHEEDITCKETEHKVKLHPSKLGSIKKCRLGQQVFVLGSPYGKINFNALSLGVVSGLNRNWDHDGPDGRGWSIAFTVDSAGHPGNSGGPVFTADGIVRGILVGGFSPVLISVMPCDLFMEDIVEVVKLFKTDKYRREEKVDNPYYYGYIVETEDVKPEDKPVGVEGREKPGQ